MRRVRLQELRPAEARLLRIGYRAVKDRLTGDAPVRYARAVLRPGAGVQGMAAHAGDEHRVEVALIAGVERPEHVVRVEDVHVLVHQYDVLELRKGGKGQERRLPLPALVRGRLLAYLQDGHILAAAGAVGADVQDPAGHRPLQHAQDAGLRRDPGHVHMLLAGAYAGLEDGIFPVRQGLDLEQAALGACHAVVSGELGHCVARSGVLVLLHAHAGDELALDDELRPRYGPLVHRDAAAELHGLAAERTGYRQLVIAQGRRGRLKAGADLYRRVHAYGDGDGQRAAELLRPVRHGPDVPAARLKKDGKLVPALDAEPVYRDVGTARVRVRGVAHAERDIWSGVQGRVLRCGQKPAEVEVRLGRQVYDFLAGRRRVPQHGLDRPIDAGAQQLAQVRALAAEQGGHPLARCQHSNGGGDAGEAPQIPKQHRRTVGPRRAHDRSSRPHAAVYAGELRLRVHLHLRLRQLTRPAAQEFQGRAQIVHAVFKPLHDGIPLFRLNFLSPSIAWTRGGLQFVFRAIDSKTESISAAEQTAQPARGEPCGKDRGGGGQQDELGRGPGEVEEQAVGELAQGLGAHGQRGAEGHDLPRHPLRRAPLYHGDGQDGKERAHELARAKGGREQDKGRDAAQGQREGRGRRQQRETEGADEQVPAPELRAKYAGGHGAQHGGGRERALRRAVVLRGKAEDVADKVRQAHEHRASCAEAEPSGQQQEPEHAGLLTAQEAQAFRQVRQQAALPTRTAPGGPAQADEELQPRRHEKAESRGKQHRFQTQSRVHQAAQEGRCQGGEGRDLVHHGVAAEHIVPAQELGDAGLHRGRLKSAERG